MKSNNHIKPFHFFVVLVFLCSCSKMNDLHKEYLDRGETIYVGKPDSVLVFAGKERVKLRYWSSDPKAAKLVVYWLSRTDSIVVDIPPHLPKDPIDIVIANLPENNYSFELFTMNKDSKNRSVALQSNGSSFGEEFQSYLVDRQIESSRLLSADELEIKWLSAVEKGIGTEVVYLNSSGNTVTKFVPMSEQSTVIEDLNGDVKYRTLFLPETSAIDTFYTPLKAVSFDKAIVMNKALFMKWNPPGIAYSQLSGTYAITKLWDDTPATFYIQTAPSFPHSFTFDMGETVKLLRFKQWQRLTASVIYKNQNVKEFELWGSSTPNVSDSFSGWVKLGEYESHKPSGLPLGQVSDLDVAFATEGETFTVDPNAPPVRYIRYVIKDTWDGKTGAVTVAEMTFFKSL